MKTKLELLNHIKSYVAANYDPSAANYEVSLVEDSLEVSSFVKCEKRSVSAQYGIDYGSVPPALRDLHKKIKSSWCSEVFWIIVDNEYLF